MNDYKLTCLTYWQVHIRLNVVYEEFSLLSLGLKLTVCITLFLCKHILCNQGSAGFISLCLVVPINANCVFIHSDL